MDSSFGSFGLIPEPEVESRPSRLKVAQPSAYSDMGAQFDGKSVSSLHSSVSVGRMESTCPKYGKRKIYDDKK